MQQVPKDVDLIIFRFVNRDLMKQLIKEYRYKVVPCECITSVCKGHISLRHNKRNELGISVSCSFEFNYRHVYDTKYTYIYNMFYKRAFSRLPENY